MTKVHFYKNILENQSDTKKIAWTAQNQLGSPCKFLCQIYFQVCSYKKWTLIKEKQAHDFRTTI